MTPNELKYREWLARQGVATRRAAVKTNSRGDELGARLARLSGKERARALWTHYQTEFAKELRDPAAFDKLPEACQRAIAVAKADAVGESSLNERERRALNFNEGMRYGFTPNARLAVRR